MKNKGFTLIELVVVIVLACILGVALLPRYINFKKDSQTATMMAMFGAVKSAASIIALTIKIRPEALNGAQNRFTLSDGQNIRVRGKLADGRWNNTFIYLLHFNEISQVSSNECNDTSLKWCVRQRGQAWFNSRGYSPYTTGRGFVIFPFGYHLNRNSCYIYYINPNATAIPDTVLPTIIGIELSGC